ncbi:MAG: hypothetical protein ACOVMH_05540 [Flavobacterium sp.]
MIDYIKLQQLSDKVKANTATQSEKDEYMKMLYQNGSITQNQYEKYLKDKSNNDLWETAKTIGGILLLGFLLKKLFENKE